MEQWGIFLVVFAAVNMAISVALALDRFRRVQEKYQVGDYIATRDYSGRITGVGFLSMTLCTGPQSQVVVPHSYHI